MSVTRYIECSPTRHDWAYYPQEGRYRCKVCDLSPRHPTEPETDDLWPLGPTTSALLFMLAIGVCVYALCQYLG